MTLNDLFVLLALIISFFSIFFAILNKILKMISRSTEKYQRQIEAINHGKRNLNHTHLKDNLDKQIKQTERKMTSHTEMDPQIKRDLLLMKLQNKAQSSQSKTQVAMNNQTLGRDFVSKTVEPLVEIAGLKEITKEFLPQYIPEKEIVQPDQSSNSQEFKIDVHPEESTLAKVDQELASSLTSDQEAAWLDELTQFENSLVGDDQEEFLQVHHRPVVKLNPAQGRLQAISYKDMMVAKEIFGPAKAKHSRL
ncbi:hypothetical protein [Vaginisenegalia massiliensis]|uniref:hypothetical protein n=1 Tax=Vaginisenegalia massiliensis TaxID=2058294 RepID=UPI000F534D7E|nr:hypothetical protein [Vaginisenegalia massiliensis]